MPIYNSFAGGRGGTPPTAVSLTDLADGDYLRYSSADVAFVNTPVAGQVTTLDSVTDVTITSAASGDYLKYNGTAWVNSAFPSLTTTLAGLTDVDIDTPSSGQVLKYDGTNWVNSAVSGSVTSFDDLSDVAITTPAAGHVVAYNSGSAWANTSAPQITTIELGHASDTTLSRSSAGVLAVEGNAVYAAGGTDVAVADGGTGASTAASARTNLGLTSGRIWVPAASMWPTTTNGATGPSLTETATNQINYWGLDFADAATSNAEATIAMPDDWDASTVTVQFYWLADSTSSNAVVWTVEAIALNDGTAIDTAYGTSVSKVDNNAGTANQVRVSAATSAMTVGGSPAAGSLVQYRFIRSGTSGSDTLAATATLLGAMVFYTKT